MNENHFLQIITTVFIAGIFSSCTSLTQLDSASQPVFVSQDIKSYKIRKIALLPVLPDTKFFDGTYIASDYFLDLLVTEYPKLDFAEINDIRKYDCSFLSEVIADISEYNRINQREFLKTELGLKLKKWKCDAVIVGVVDSTTRKKEILMSRLFDGDIFRVLTTTFFKYYLISLKDGSVLWTVSEAGSEYFNPFGKNHVLYLISDKSVDFSTPIDLAICNGIEKLAEKLPEAIFNND